MYITVLPYLIFFISFTRVSNENKIIKEEVNEISFQKKEVVGVYKS